MIREAVRGCFGAVSLAAVLAAASARPSRHALLVDGAPWLMLTAQAVVRLVAVPGRTDGFRRPATLF